MEEHIVKLMRDVLQVEVAAHDTDLFDSGILDSLALISLITEIETYFGFEIPLDDFDVESFSSVEQIAAFVAANQPDADAPAS